MTQTPEAAGELAAKIQAEITRGDPATVITEIGSLAEGGAEQLAPFTDAVSRADEGKIEEQQSE